MAKKQIEKPENKTVFEETVKIYPAGRGKILAITEKRILPKVKRTRKNTRRLCLSRIKTNPSDISFTIFLDNNDIKRTYIFTPSVNKQLSYDERLDVCSSLAITLIRDSKDQHLINKELRNQIKIKLKRYNKWKNKNE